MSNAAYQKQFECNTNNMQSHKNAQPISPSLLDFSTILSSIGESVSKDHKIHPSKEDSIKQPSNFQMTSHINHPKWSSKHKCSIQQYHSPKIQSTPKRRSLHINLPSSRGRPNESPIKTIIKIEIKKKHEI